MADMNDMSNDTEQDNDPNSRTWVVPDSTLPELDAFLQGLVHANGRLYAECVIHAFRLSAAVNMAEKGEAKERAVKIAAFQMASMAMGLPAHITQDEIMRDAGRVMELGVVGVKKQMADKGFDPEEFEKQVKAGESAIPDFLS